MSFAMEEALESGWVAVRPHAFDEKEKHKFIFIVAWNKVEGKFAITCHNRTVQRRSFARDSDVVAAEAVQEGQVAHGKSPAKEKGERDRSASPADGDSSRRMQLKDKPGRMSSPAKSPGKGMEPLSKGSTAATEGAGPSLTKDDPCKAEGEAADAGDSESNVREDYSWAGLFSFQDLRAVHFQLCSVNSDLEPCLPAFPEEPSGMWTVLFGLPEVTQTETDALCYQLQVYLGHALDTCGWKILSQVLFAESDDPEEYYESLSELRQKGYEEALERARMQLHQLLERHKAAESMVELLKIYQEEDEVYETLVETTTELYQYLLQPFRDMRELAMLRRQQIKISIENDYLGPRRIESLKREDLDWQAKAHEAVLSIQDLTVKYFEITAKAQKAVHERMRSDQKKFGKASWAVAVERMERLQCAVSKETLQLMRAREICLEQKKQGLREEMQTLQDTEDAMTRLDQLEAQYYELQLHLYEIQFEVLKCEELLLTTQRESLQRQITEWQDEVVYYDTYESTEAMVGADEPRARAEELTRLQQRVRQLEARRGRIATKKAYLRKKKEICIASHNQKVQQRQGGQEDQTTPHTLQQQLEQQRVDEESRNARVSQERRRTLEGLRSFKQRYPGQVILKSTRLRLAYSQRKRDGASSQPLAASPRVDQGGLAMASSPPEVTAVASGKPESTSLPPGGAVVPETLPMSPSPTSLVAEGVEPSPSTPTALLRVSGPSPPLPPPPLPPLAEDSLSEDGRPLGLAQQDGRSGWVLRASKPLVAPISACFFDSSQLVDARKKLRKTPMLETPQRRASSPMDEVLASLKRGSFHLRRVEATAPRPAPSDDDASNILAQIRKGVQLRKVPPRDPGERLSSDDPLARSIHEALRRIKEASPESESEDEGLPSADWES
ncbi:junction-mediating and -regulatory protein-like isoform X1 [Scleropages formosus]|uniref:Junction mediating and regulatory protein, p53 cofactor n=1 Tax=Scleropages formosus TaxID=113540 RepID=A0A8C9RAL4_SCLFO|nr:junction-mediating and -regulatory protein-like isoform X1 [Scleropages formosus]